MANGQKSIPEQEEATLSYWREIGIDKLVEAETAKRAEQFKFYDGPPFANGLPHYGHILPMSIKDSIVRYHLLKGQGVRLQFGWDTHGLPVEFEIEKQLGLKSKTDIEKLGIAKFTEACRASVLKYEGEWRSTIARMGRLGRTDNPYLTMDRNYMQIIWVIIKRISELGLLERSFKSMPYCPRCATPLSNFETNQGYKDDVSAESVFVKFKRLGKENEYFLAWTTTPWTLPGNAALAVNPEAEYGRYKMEDGSTVIMATELAEMVFDSLTKDRHSEATTVADESRANEAANTSGVLRGYRMVTPQNDETIFGRDLVNTKYEPLYPEAISQATPNKTGEAYRIVAGDFVSLEDGTGIVHIAPAFGEDDLELGKKENLPIIQTLNDRGLMTAPEFAKGQWFEKANGLIAADLDNRGLLFARQPIKHTYPFCWRCDTPLVYYAMPAWFVKVSAVKDKLVANNQGINWIPAHLQDGRFGKWLEGARDWAISRNRYWGNPLPIWECKECGEYVVFGSVDEVMARQTNDAPLDDLHRPMIDAVEIKCACGSVAKRVPDVLDCWFESGSMPYASTGNTDYQASIPADFIAEGLDQTRGWFYTLHVLATILSDGAGGISPAFKNVIVNGMILAKDGKKLSKKLRNYPEISEVFTSEGADALRWFLLGSPAVEAEEVRFSAEAISDTKRKRLIILHNILSFYQTYAGLHGLEGSVSPEWPETSTLLTRWLVARTDDCTTKMAEALDNYRIPRATRALSDYVDDLSLWYVRRSRESVRADADPALAKETLATLGTALYKLSHLMLPVAPFFAEHLYQTVTAGQMEQSVQLSRWPLLLRHSEGAPEGAHDESRFDANILTQVATIRQAASELLRLRQEAKLPVKQPLSQATVYAPSAISQEGRQMIADEVNVQEVLVEQAQNFSVKLDTQITPELERLAEEREFVRAVQGMRKTAGVEFNQTVALVAETTDETIKTTLSGFAKKYEQRLHIDKLEMVEALPDSVMAEFSLALVGQPIRLALMS